MAFSVATLAPAEEPHWLPATAHVIPKETTSEGSGYFSIIEGHNGRLYVGTAKYRSNAYLVEFDPASQKMRIVVDAQKEIGATATGFAAQAKIHTRNNVGESGKIYFGTKQGYPKEGESRDLYAGGYPMVFDPASGKTKVYPIPIPHQGIISVTPDEARGVAYLSTCSDGRPLDSTHFMVLDLAKGTYRDLGDLQHMYAFVVVDYLGRAYHPWLGGDIARLDPATGQLARLHQTIDGAPPKPDSHLADPESHPINWDLTPDRKTLYSVAMSGNMLYSYDLTATGDVLPGKSLGKLLAGAKATDCRGFCVGPTAECWATVLGTEADGQSWLHLVSYRAGDEAPRDHGRLEVRNRDFTPLVDAAGKQLPFHHGFRATPDNHLVPLYHMGVCQAKNGSVYAMVICPLTLLEVSRQELGLPPLR